MVLINIDEFKVVSIYLDDLELIYNLNVKGIKLLDKIVDIKKLASKLEYIKPSVKLIDFLYKDELEDEFKKRNTYQGFQRSILNKVKQIISLNITKDDYVVDMTVGNGNDTLYLCKYAKFVYGFDIQKKAINNTKELLTKNNYSNYQLFLESHVNINKLSNIKLVLFNLGYLPNGNKDITTMSDTTLEALKNCFNVILDDGFILIVFYPHEEGKKEANTIINYLDDNKINYKIYRNTKNINAPFLLVIH